MSDAHEDDRGATCARCGRPVPRDGETGCSRCGYDPMTAIRLIIAGSRDVVVRHVDIDDAVSDLGPITEVVVGCARGPDSVGETWARRRGIPVKRFPADWSVGKKAGPLRNEAMAAYVGKGGHLLAFWDGTSRGTADMIRRARAHGLRQTVCRLGARRP